MITRNIRKIVRTKTGSAHNQKIVEPRIDDDYGAFVSHFKHLPAGHPLRARNTVWQNPTYNHVWDAKEVHEAMDAHPKHQPQTATEKTSFWAVRFAYHFFNALIGFRKADPSPGSCVRRLIVLESIAGVPGFVAAYMRHLRSLRTLQRDYGWIHTLLAEAENERMHLLTVLTMFRAGYFTRALVFCGQMVMVPTLSLVAMISPKTLHRFVGYIEETAVHTYTDLIHLIETDGTRVNLAWKDLQAPSIAKNYWKMDDNSMWIDVLKQICADEANHRDVNHTFASMKSDDPNPWVTSHHLDARNAWMFMENQAMREDKKYLQKRL